MSITGLLPPNYDLTDSSHQAPTITPLYIPTNRKLSRSLPTLLPQSHLCFMIPFIHTTSSPDHSPSTEQTPDTTPYVNPESLPPLPSISTTSIIEYPDPLTSHDAARTLAMRCLRETSSINLNPDVLPEMDQALTTTIQQLQHETTEIETILPQLPIFITNLQTYHSYCTSRLAETRHTINHLQAVRAVITTFTPRPSVTRSTPTLHSLPNPTTRPTPSLPTMVPPSQPDTPVTAISTSVTLPPDLIAPAPITIPSLAPPLLTTTSTEGASHPTPAQPTSTTNAPVPTPQHITPTHQHGDTYSTTVASHQTTHPITSTTYQSVPTSNLNPDRPSTSTYRAPQRPRSEYNRRNRSNSPPYYRRTDSRHDYRSRPFDSYPNYPPSPDYDDYAPYPRDYRTSRRTRDPSPPTRNVRPHDTPRTYRYDSQREPTRHSTPSLRTSRRTPSPPSVPTQTRPVTTSPTSPS